MEPAHIAFWFAAALLIARLGMFIRLHQVSDRHPVREAVSDYGVGPTQGLFTAMSWTTAAAWALLAVGTWFGRTGWHDRTTAAVIFAALAGIVSLIPLVPTDLEGEHLTLRGTAHYLLAIVQFALAYNLSGNVTQLLGGSYFSVLHVIAMVSLIGLCVCLAPSLRRLFGAFERVFLVSIVLLYLGYAVVSALG